MADCARRRAATARACRICDRIWPIFPAREVTVDRCLAGGANLGVPWLPCPCISRTAATSHNRLICAVLHQQQRGARRPLKVGDLQRLPQSLALQTWLGQSVLAPLVEHVSCHILVTTCNSTAEALSYASHQKLEIKPLFEAFHAPPSANKAHCGVGSCFVAPTHVVAFATGGRRLAMDRWIKRELD